MPARKTITDLLAGDHQALDQRYRRGRLARRLPRLIRLWSQRKRLILIISALGGLALALAGLHASGVSAQSSPLVSMLTYGLIGGVTAMVALLVSQGD